MSSMKYLLVIVMLAALASSALTIRCYNCNSMEDVGCGEHFNSDDLHVVDCSSPEILHVFGHSRRITSCLKMIRTSVDGDLHVMRSCDFITQHICMDDSSENLTCDLCTNDLCNGN